jgi:hypothetical protein
MLSTNANRFGQPFQSKQDKVYSNGQRKWTVVEKTSIGFQHHKFWRREDAVALIEEHGE